MLPILPVTLANTLSGDFVLIASQGGVNFYIGNNPESDALRAVVPGTRTDWWGGYNDAIFMAEEALGRKLKPSEVSRYWYGRGLEFLWVFPRQSGKDETIAQLVTFLLTLFHRIEACLIHVYPTSQQITTGATRLERRLANPWLAGQIWTRAKPLRLGLGLAQCAFFSGHPQSRAEGATANLLLIVNEVQDQVEPIIERRFTPMRASTNATALYVGTVRTTHDYLWKLKTRLEALQAADGIQRVFFVSADQVGRENPHYGRFVENQIRLKGRQHPTVKTELFNEPLDTSAGLFARRRLALMRGRHPHQETPAAGALYVATIDVGGQDEAATTAFADLVNPGRDYTVTTVHQVLPAGSGDVGPAFQAVDVFVDHGSRHFQDHDGRPSLFRRILAYLNHWSVAAVVCDASGVGQGLADALAETFTRPVIPFDFARSHGKARLGNDFLALVETGRFRYFTDTPANSAADEPEGSDAWWFFTQCRLCNYELAEGVPIERGLRWQVPPAATVTLADGQTLPVHDDRLLSAALVAEADALIRRGDLFVGTSESAVIARPDAAEAGSEWA